MTLTKEEADSIIEVVNERATELRQLIITIASIIALVLPAAEGIGLVDFTPYGEGDDEWVIDEDWEMGDDFVCGDGSVIEYSLVDDGYKNCRDGSDEPEENVEDCEETDTCEEPDISYGCMDEDALNYDEEAWEDDGSCEYEEEPEETYGCTDPEAENYDPYADHDDDSCQYQEGEQCDPVFYDVYWSWYNENITFSWDADLSCFNDNHNLTVYWTIYENNSTGKEPLQDKITYETFGNDYEQTNMTIGNLSKGKYDIFATFEIHGDYTRGVDWYGVEINDS